MIEEKKFNALESANSVFVSLGTHPEQFNRLLKEIDRLIEKKIFPKNVFVQNGNSNYNGKSYDFMPFLAIPEFNKKVEECSVFITHAGEGNIGIAKNFGKKFICVPRRKEFSEHTNDHQLELAQVVEQKGLGLVAWNVEDLEKKFLELKSFIPKKIPRGKIVQILDKYVKGELKW